jgi:hypothetical protein
MVTVVSITVQQQQQQQQQRKSIDKVSGIRLEQQCIPQLSARAQLQ